MNNRSYMIGANNQRLTSFHRSPATMNALFSVFFGMGPYSLLKVSFVHFTWAVPKTPRSLVIIGDSVTTWKPRISSSKKSSQYIMDSNHPKIHPKESSKKSSNSPQVTTLGKKHVATMEVLLRGRRRHGSHDLRGPALPDLGRRRTPWATGLSVAGMSWWIKWWFFRWENIVVWYGLMGFNGISWCLTLW